MVNAENEKTSINCSCLFKRYIPFLAYFVQMRLFLGLILFLIGSLFYRGLEFTEPREIEFDFKGDRKFK